DRWRPPRRPHFDAADLEKVRGTDVAKNNRFHHQAKVGLTNTCCAQDEGLVPSAERSVRREELLSLPPGVPPLAARACFHRERHAENLHSAVEQVRLSMV